MLHRCASALLSATLCPCVQLGAVASRAARPAVLVAAGARPGERCRHVLPEPLQKDLSSCRECYLGVQTAFSCHLLQRWHQLQRAALSKAMPFPSWPTYSNEDVKAQVFGTNMTQFNSRAPIGLGEAVQASWLLLVLTPTPALHSTGVTPKSTP